MVMLWSSKIVKNTPKSSNHRNTHTAIALRVRTFVIYKYGYKKKRISHSYFSRYEMTIIENFCFSPKISQNLDCVLLLCTKNA